MVIDYQNVLTRGSRLFADLTPKSASRSATAINPLLLAQQAVAERNRINWRKQKLQLSRINVYRGLPSASADPEENSINQAQKSRWEAESSIPLEVIQRSLSYRWNPFTQGSSQRQLNPSSHPRFPNKSYQSREEKGVDVMCAVAVLRHLQDSEIDAVILASIDSDLEPALEEGLRVYPLKTIETVSWFSATEAGGKNRIGAKLGIWNTGLGRSIYESVVEPEQF